MEEAEVECTLQDGTSVVQSEIGAEAPEDNPVRLLVQEEGRAARNLIAFSVPCDMGQPDSGKFSRKPPSSPRTVQDGKKEDGSQRNTKRTVDVSTPGSRVRSASTGRDKKSEIQARYWAFLFGNLQRAVDEIYQTCETDESVSECKEVILVLENFTRDFHSLIEWFRLKWEYEKTPPPQRPTSLAWEVRKSSPGKVHHSTTPILNGLSHVKRNLHFGDGNEKDRMRPSVDKMSDSVMTGKCSPVSPLTIPPLVEDQEVCCGSQSSREPSNKAAVPAPPNPLSVMDTTDENVITQCAASSTQIAQENEILVTVSKNSELPVNELVTNITENKELPDSIRNHIVGKIRKESSVQELIKEINSENEKSCSDNKLVKDILVSSVGGARCSSAEVLLRCDEVCDLNVTSSGLPGGMVNQASQTDLDFDDVPLDQICSPLMVDKGVGTASLITKTATGSIPTGPSSSLSASLSGRTPSSGGISTRTGSSSTVTSSNAAKTTTTASFKNNTTSRIVSSSLKSAACCSATVPAGSANMTNGAAASGGVVRTNVTTAVNSVLSKVASTVMPTTQAAASTSCTTTTAAAPKTSLANIVTKPSTASIVKRNISRVTTNISGVRDTPSSQSRACLTQKPHHPTSSTVTPRLTRSRTIAEVSRPNRQTTSQRSGTAHQQHGTLSGSGRLAQTRASNSFESGADRRRNRDGARNAQNTNSALDRNKKNESADDAGWETVKNRSRWRLSYNPKLRFTQPSCAVSLPALIIVDDIDYEPSRKTSASRRNSEKLTNPENSSLRPLPADKVELSSCVKKTQSAKLAGVSKSSPKTHIDKGINGNAKHAEVKKTSKELKEEINKSFAKNKVQSKDHSAPNTRNGLRSTKSQDVINSLAEGVKNCKYIKNLSSDNKKLINDDQLPSAMNGNKPAALDLDSQLSGDESSVGPRTSPTTTPATTPPTMTPTTTPATPTTPTNSASESLAFLRDSDVNADRLISDDEDLIAERTLLKEEERKSQQLCEEEAKLQQQIQDLQNGDLEVEVETDGETQLGTEEEEEEEEEELLDGEADGYSSRDTEADTMSLEDRYENMLEGLSWAERMDTLEQLEALDARHPGRALQLHQKLSSPSRCRASTLPETLRRFQARQDKAQQKRERLLQLKSQRLRDLLNKVGEVKAAQAQLTEARRLRLETKLKRAEENRNLHLRSIKRKAHDEEEKLKEIAFINELEAQNKRHDFLALCQEQEERLQGIAEERARRQEEKAAKEAAVEERRRALEAQRQHKLQEMQARRRRREERMEREQLEKEKGRQEAAREKARDREERLSALHAAQLATQEELQKKIQQKQEDSARRHEENIEHIRQRALESAALRCADDVAPALAPYRSKKLCTLCNVLIGSEVYLLSHLRGKSHQELARAARRSVTSASASVGARDELQELQQLQHITDAPPGCVDEKQERHRDRQRALRKRAKKIRLRMAARGQEYENSRETQSKADSPNCARLQKCLRDVEKLRSSQGVGQWSNNAVTLLERALAEMNRILDKKVENDQSAFCALSGFSTLCGILSLGLDVPKNMTPYIPPKCFVTACTTLSLACRDHPENANYVLLSNRVATILDLLVCRLKEVVPDDADASLCWSPEVLPADNVAAALMRLLALLLTHAEGHVEDNVMDAAARARDVVSLTVSLGAVDRLAAACGAVRDPLPESERAAAAFLLAGLDLLTELTARCGGVGRADPTGLGATLRSTELVGAVSMLYGLLLQQGGAPRDPDATPPDLAPHAASLARATIALLVRVAELDLAMFQSVLGAEGISLQLRHISAHLLWVCALQDELRDLLHLVIRVLGYFAVRNRDNQVVLQSGHQPTVLQQLCGLPFPYFSVPALCGVLFPSLLACCDGNPENRAILEHELSYQLLEDFRQSDAAHGDRLVALLQQQQPRKCGPGQKQSKQPSRAASRAHSAASSRDARDANGPDVKKAKTEDLAQVVSSTSVLEEKSLPKESPDDVDAQEDVMPGLEQPSKTEIRTSEDEGEMIASDASKGPPHKRQKKSEDPRPHKSSEVVIKESVTDSLKQSPKATSKDSSKDSSKESLKRISKQFSSNEDTPVKKSVMTRELSSSKLTAKKTSKKSAKSLKGSREEI